MIIIVDPDQAFHARVGAALDGTRWEPMLTPVSTVSDAVDLLRSSPQVHAAIGGPDLTFDDGVLLAEHATASRAGTAVLLVAQPTTDNLRRAMRAGARDVLSPRFDARELIAALTDAGVAAGGPAPLPGLTISVLGVKGGVGSSVVASNLAIRLAEASSAPVALADLDLASADLAVMHGVSARWTIQDIADGTVGHDIESLRDILHDIGSSGARLLPGPVDPALAERITAVDVAKLIALLRSESPLVVLDLATSFDDRTLAALDATDLLILTCGLDVASLRGLAVALRTLEQLGVAATRIRVALVRADSKAGLTVGDVERTIGRVVDLKLPSTRAVPRSVNEGVPLALSSTRSGVVQAIDELVADILELVPDGLAGASDDEESRDGGLRRLLGRSKDEDPPTSAPTAPAEPDEQTEGAADTPHGAEATGPHGQGVRPRVVRRQRVEPTDRGPRASASGEDRTLFLNDEGLSPPVPIDRARRESSRDESSSLSAMPPPVAAVDQDHNDDENRHGGRHLRRS